MTSAIQSIDAPAYKAVIHDDDDIIERAIAILRGRLNDGPAMSSPDVVKQYLMASEPQDGREHFRVVWLDARHKVIEVEHVCSGTLTQASVYPREVVKSALAKHAAACILTHNHPSGMVEESQADKLLTKHLKDALAMVDVNVLDHIITASGNCLSFAEKGII